MQSTKSTPQTLSGWKVLSVFWPTGLMAGIFLTFLGYTLSLLLSQQRSDLLIAISLITLPMLIIVLPGLLLHWNYQRYTVSGVSIENDRLVLTHQEVDYSYGLNQIKAVEVRTTSAPSKAMWTFYQYTRVTMEDGATFFITCYVTTCPHVLGRLPREVEVEQSSRYFPWIKSRYHIYH